jgi:DNA-binding MarR family transcriptional regulator
MIHMNSTVELVNQWAAFEKEHPGAAITDFCRYMLIKEKQQAEDPGFLGGVIPPDLHSRFAKLIGRINKIHVSVSLPLLREYAINSFEDFAFLNSINKLERPRKTDVINSNFVELSSGLLIIGRLKKNGWISEKGDETDKRSKRLSLSTKGRKVLEQVYKRIGELNKQCFKDLSDDDIMICLKLLSPIEAALTTTWLKSRGR